ncbi:type II secretion system protein [Iodidimonas nitroreducens]|uniref:Type II secretion system protein n=1 Tax=Iodidimonas nitroreducens TaxID=1236968 RepID=A0A5A7NBR5_9PROT|nr:type II secretion system protein [Iodidimonas nitroreducens]GAK33541.1 type II secretion system protein H [alpha proteobacterium Q-1]GER04489.1 type II secretion system protein [Iodidimonas nitroreducens]
MPIFPPHAKAKASRQGFTLLEMLVVLAIMGLVLGLAAPLFTARIESGQLIQQAEAIATQMRHAPMRARLDGQALYYGVEGNPPPDARPLDFDLPDGWIVRSTGPLMISDIGLCAGGEITLIAPSGRSLRLQIRPPLCETIITNGPQQAG